MRFPLFPRLNFTLALPACLLALAGCNLPPIPPKKAERPKPAAPKPPAFAVKTELPRLHTRGKFFVDKQNEPVRLRGCNLGNWLLLEMWMLDCHEDIRDQAEFEALLASRFGEQEKERLMELYRAGYITARDMDIVRSFKFNVVRVPFNYRLLESDEAPFELKPDAFRWLDRALELAAGAGLYVVLDLHGAPGGQSVDHTTGREGVNTLWTNPEEQKRTVWLWRQIAGRYKDVDAVAAYDLLNEPFGDYQTGKHQAALRALVGRLYEAIRTTGDEHIILLPGSREGIRFYGNPRDQGWENVAFTEHYYPALMEGARTLEGHARFIGERIQERARYLDQLDVPMFIGEFNVVLDSCGGPVLTRQYFDLYNDLGWGATMWCYKLLQKSGGIGGDNWFMVKNAEALPPIRYRTSSRAEIEAFFRSLATMKLAVFERLRAALTTEHPTCLALAHYEPKLVEAPAHDGVAPWRATDIGGALPGGQERLGDDALRVYGGGRDIWNDHDQFRFVWRAAPADFVLTAKLEKLFESSPYAKAGLMVREGLDPGAGHLLLHAFPDGQVVLGWREKSGGTMKEKKLLFGDLPVYLRLERHGNAVTAYISWDGTEWTRVARRRFDWLRGECKAGLAVLAHDGNASLTTAVFKDIRYREAVP